MHLFTSVFLHMHVNICVLLLYVWFSARVCWCITEREKDLKKKSERKDTDRDVNKVSSSSHCFPHGSFL